MSLQPQPTGLPAALSHAGAVVAGLILGPLSIQGFYGSVYFAVGSSWVGWAVLITPPIVVLAASAIIWTKGYRWFAGGVAAGTVLWSVFLIWPAVDLSAGVTTYS